MTIFLTANNAGTTLAGSISSAATTAALAPGTGSLFPSPVAGQQFALTFVDALTGLVDEIVYVQGITGDTITAMTRGQEGTTPRGWLAGDLASNFWTSGQITALQNLALFSPSVVGSVRNAKMSVTTASATATFAADEVVVETALGGQTYKLASFSSAINLATTGAGGMDTGTVPVTGYVALYSIYNPSTQTSALLATNAATVQGNVYGGANMPVGYAASALVGVWPVATSKFIVGYQADRVISFVLASALSSSTVVGSYTSLSIAGIVPANAKTVSGTLTLTSTAASQTAVVVAGSSTAINAENLNFTNASAGTWGGQAPFNNIPLITAQTIFYTTQTSSGTPNFGIFINSYTF